jgi:NO-binding membrane sensor protein with MHYT domain
MIPEFDPSIVILSYGVAFLAVYMSICACEQLRGIYLKYGNPRIQHIIYWLTIIGISLGGAGMWGVRYIGTMTIKDENGNVVHFGYNIGMALIALVVGVVTTILGVYIASKDKLYAKSKSEVLEFLVSKVNIDEALSYTEFQILYLLATKELTYLVTGGLIAGAGGIAVFFIDMAAMEFPGFVRYSGGLVFLAIILALNAGVSAFWIFFRLLSIYPDYESLRFITSFAGGFGVCIVHYVAVISVHYHIDPNRHTTVSWNTGVLMEDDAFYMVLLAAMLLFWIIVMMVFADLRRKINLYRIHLQKLAPNEKLSDLLNTAENSLDPREASNHGKNSSRKISIPKNAVAPLPFDVDESPI